MSRAVGRRHSVVAAAVLVAATLSVAVEPASAAVTIAKVQSGTIASSTTGTLTMTLPASSTPSTLLVASLIYVGATPSFAAPAGWTRGPNASMTGGSAEIWYYANNPGSITSVAFTATSGPIAGGALSEWSGVDTTSPLDQSGTATATSNTNTITVTSASSTIAPGELGVASFTQILPNSQSLTFTPATGWTNLVSSAGTNSSAQHATDYRLGLAAGAQSEQETSSRNGTWAAALATFRPRCSGGSLTLTPPPSVTFPATTLNGVDQTKSTTATLTANDMTGSGSGWNIQGTSTTFTATGGSTLPTTATRITAASAAAASGNCSVSTNSVTYPVTVPAAASAPTAAKLYNAAANTGLGPVTVTLTFQLTVPAATRAGSYSSAWTFSLVSGP